MNADTLIIGAGVSGLHAAKLLREAGQSVLVLEKSRGLGGRAATRRWDNFPVDHGAQFFTARSPEFTAQVAKWSARGVCAAWTRGFHQYLDGTLLPPTGEPHPRYACPAGMSALGRELAGPEPEFVRKQTRAAHVRVEETGWIITSEDGREFRAPRLLVATPPAQAAVLLRDSCPGVAAQLEAVRMTPSLALVLRYPRRPLAFCGIQIPNHPVLSWIGHDTSKRPDLHPGATILVLHASLAFSGEHYGSNESAIVGIMLRAAGEITGENLATPDAMFLQRWRYALADGERLTPPIIAADTPAPLVAAGDALAGGKIEGAWLSGRAAAASFRA
ncbi:MAG: NAD(P)/FAD-dependent oxidoreductase [Chthoniobacterales bacterium]